MKDSDQDEGKQLFFNFFFILLNNIWEINVFQMTCLEQSQNQPNNCRGKASLASFKHGEFKELYISDALKQHF